MTKCEVNKDIVQGFILDNMGKTSRPERAKVYSPGQRPG